MVDWHMPASPHHGTHTSVQGSTLASSTSASPASKRCATSRSESFFTIAGDDAESFERAILLDGLNTTTMPFDWLTELHCVACTATQYSCNSCSRTAVVLLCCTAAPLHLLLSCRFKDNRVLRPLGCRLKGGRPPLRVFQG
jgi:hypothetical protein